MPITGMKRPINVVLHVATPSGSLIATSGGHNAAGNVAIDLFEGDGTGYTNRWQDYTIPVQFTPGVAKRYDLTLQGYRFLGECSIKVESKYADLIESGSYITMNNADWDYTRLAEWGVGFGNDRIVLALNRRRAEQ